MRGEPFFECNYARPLRILIIHHRAVPVVDLVDGTLEDLVEDLVEDLEEDLVQDLVQDLIQMVRVLLRLASSSALGCVSAGPRWPLPSGAAGTSAFCSENVNMKRATTP